MLGVQYFFWKTIKYLHFINNIKKPKYLDLYLNTYVMHVLYNELKTKSL